MRASLLTGALLASVALAAPARHHKNKHSSSQAGSSTAVASPTVAAVAGAVSAPAAGISPKAPSSASAASPKGASSVAAAVPAAATVPSGGASAKDWSVQVGAPWQIILSSNLQASSGLEPSTAQVWDLDLFNTDTSTIQSLKSQGKTVICYFSAGTSEPGRPDLGSLGSGDKGAALPDWPGENWLNLQSDTVKSIMAARVQTAASKGCDAVDPDNMDGYANDNAGGLGLTQQDSVEFMQMLVDTAHGLGIGIGLKNALDIIPSVGSLVDFAVNEQCAQYGECNSYDSMIAAGKPVFHIEYTDANAKGSGAHNGAPVTQADNCPTNFSTVMKTLALDGWVQYCDGSEFTSPTSS